MRKIYSKKELPHRFIDELKRANGQWVTPADLAKKYNVYPYTVSLTLRQLILDGKPIERERLEGRDHPYSYRWTGGDL